KSVVQTTDRFAVNSTGVDFTKCFKSSDDNIYFKVEDDSKFDISKVGKYTVSMKVGKVEKNPKEEIIDYEFEVYDDEKPVITLTKKHVTIKQFKKNNFDNYVSVEDNSGETIQTSIDDGGFNNAFPSNYTITYTAKDSSNNESVVKQKVTVTALSLPDILGLLYKGYKRKAGLDEYNYKFFDDDTVDIYNVGSIDLFDADFKNNLIDYYIYYKLEVIMHKKNMGTKNDKNSGVKSDLALSYYQYEIFNTKFPDKKNRGYIKSASFSSPKGKVILNNTLYNKNYGKNNIHSYLSFKSEKQIDDFEKLIKANSVTIRIKHDKGMVIKRKLSKKYLIALRNTVKEYRRTYKYMANHKTKE
nr:DUF5011 domain-containing protein [Lachnospiraceae bacterium]